MERRGGLDARSAVTAYRGDSRVTSAALNPSVAKRWQREAALAASLGLVSAIYRSRKYAELVAAVEQAIRDGIAEGEADVMAYAAAAQRLGPFSAGRAFAAALDRLQGDYGPARDAQEAAERMIKGAAADVARALADADVERSLDEVAAYVDTFLTGDEVGAVARWTEQALWSAFGAGQVALYRQAAPRMTAGIGLLVEWETDSDPCATCAANRDGGPYAPEDVPPYPGHPNHCRCWLSTDARFPVSMLAPFLDVAA